MAAKGTSWMRDGASAKKLKRKKSAINNQPPKKLKDGSGAARFAGGIT